MQIALNFLWSLLGTGLPLLVALVTVPALIEGLGVARFGVLSLAWVVVGYFSLFDFGLGRALTQLVAQKIGKGEEDDIPPLVQLAMALMIVLGFVGAGIVALLSPWLVAGKLQVPESLKVETLSALYLLAASIPIVIATTALRGILEARQRFDIVNIVRAPLGVLTYLGPLAVLQFSNALPALVGVLMLARVISCIAYLWVCLSLYPDLANRGKLQTRMLKPLLSFGGWMTLSNIAAPLLLYAGRLALAVMVSVEALAYFSTPYDVVINLLIIPGVVVTVLFPMLAQLFATQNQSAKALYSKGQRYLFLIMLPLCAATYFSAKPALALWISADFSEASFRVAQILAIGVFVNSFGHLSQALIQAYGRPDLTAKLHVVELIIYLPYMYWLIKHYGIEGAAVSWLVRVTISTFALSAIARRCMSGRIPLPS